MQKIVVFSLEESNYILFHWKFADQQVIIFYKNSALQLLLEGI